MKILCQRVESAALVIVENGAKKNIGEIATGLVVYVGFAVGDLADDFDKYSSKIVNLRIFEDDAGKMNKSVGDNGYGIMLIPNFTLVATTKKGNRPSFDCAMSPQEAKEMFCMFADCLQKKCKNVVLGVFGADMRINQNNLGPINIILDIKQ